MNFLAFAAFGIDKARAEQGAWRISEGTLLQLAFFGGMLGAYAGRAMFRQKTRKQPFSSNLHAIAAMQFLGVAALVAYIWFGEELALLLNTQHQASRGPPQRSAPRPEGRHGFHQPAPNSPRTPLWHQSRFSQPPPPASPSAMSTAPRLWPPRVTSLRLRP